MILFNGNMEVVKILLEAGASLEAGPNTLRPMDAAIWERNVEEGGRDAH